jgi:hypothetical protein
MPKPKGVKRVKKYTLKQIKAAISDAYAIWGHTDSWNVPVIYEEQMLDVIGGRLKKASSFIPTSK